VNPLAAHLAEQDTPCPGCGYNLRGCQNQSCPECGIALVLSVNRAGTDLYIRALRLLFLALIVWSGAGQLPGAVMEMLSAWEMVGRPGGALNTSWFFWYVVSEIIIALIVLTFSILGLRATYLVRQARSAWRHALSILIMQSLATVYHIVLALVF
jgi:hypothetical protein